MCNGWELPAAPLAQHQCSASCLWRAQGILKIIYFACWQFTLGLLSVLGPSFVSVDSAEIQPAVVRMAFSLSLWSLMLVRSMSAAASLVQIFFLEDWWLIIQQFTWERGPGRPVWGMRGWEAYPWTNCICAGERDLINQHGCSEVIKQQWR